MTLPGIFAPLAVSAGVVLLAGTVAWRVWARRRSLVSLQLAIEDPDPGVRRAALHTLGSRGLARFAAVLVQRALVETDESARHALVEVIRQNDWEPADHRDLLTLRLWAHSQPTGDPVTAFPTLPRQIQEPEAVIVATPRLTARRREHGRAGHGPVHAPVNHGPGRQSGASSAVRTPQVPVGGGVALREPGRHGSGDHRRAGVALREGPPRPPSPLPAEPPRRTGPGNPVPTVFDWAAAAPGPALPLTGAPNGHGPLPVPVPAEVPPPGRHAGTSQTPARVSTEGVTAIVTGAGGPAGIAVVRALMASGHRVVAADCDPTAAGMRLAHRARVIPAADDPGFVPALCQLAVASGAQIVVSTIAEELVVLADAGRYLQADSGVRTWVPSASAVDACADKWQFAQLLRRHGILGPATGLASAEGIPGPWVVKPRSGRGSRDVYLVDDLDDMATILRRVPDPIVQTRLHGREFTVDALVGPDGILAGAVPRWRLETKAGISTKGRTFSDDRLVREVARLLSIIGLRGPANVQGFVDPDGTPWFMEVNPRFSGGLPLSLAAGSDLVGEYVRATLGQPIRPERLTFRPDVTMIRHFTETFE